MRFPKGPDRSLSIPWWSQEPMARPLERDERGGVWVRHTRRKRGIVRALMSVTLSQNCVWPRAERRWACQALIGLAVMLAGTALWAGTTFTWIGGDGIWSNPANWGGALPFTTCDVAIHGTAAKLSRVTLAHTDVLISHLGVAEGGGSLASLVVDGPSLTVIGTIDVGEYSGSDGRFVLKSGHVFAGTFFLSGGGGPGQRGRGAVEIRGGSVVTKDIELGVSAGCRSTLRVVGSEASGIFVEDGLHIGVYNLPEPGKGTAAQRRRTGFRPGRPRGDAHLHLGQSRRSRKFSRSRWERQWCRLLPTANQSPGAASVRRHPAHRLHASLSGRFHRLGGRGCRARGGGPLLGTWSGI